MPTINFWMCKANLGAEGLGRSCRYFDASISNLFVPLVLCSVLVQHLVEGVVQLPRDSVDLELLPDDLVLKLVFNDDHTSLSILHPFVSTLKLLLHHGQGTSKVVVLHLVLRSHPS